MKIPWFAILTIVVLWIIGFAIAPLLVPMIAHFLGVNFIVYMPSDKLAPNFSFAFSFALCGASASMISLIYARKKSNWSAFVFIVSTLVSALVSLCGLATTLFFARSIFQLGADVSANFKFSNTEFSSFLGWGNWGVVLLTIFVSIILFTNKAEARKNSGLPEEKFINFPR